ncbi:MAG: ATPase [Acidobacteria bacterium]|nr:ATPase [Acidobacteriota bacterium]
MTAKLFAGIDVGTTTTKAVIVDAERQVVGCCVQRSGASLAAAADAALAKALARAGAARELVQGIVATGYGRKSVAVARDTVTEIRCHGRGSYHYFREALTIVDIGGQDSKVIKLDAAGKLVHFKMNRKCAAGTGAFLEDLAHRLDIPLSEFGPLAQAASVTASLGSYCTVFTATEVLDRLRAGEPVNSLIRGLFDSIVKRIMEMESLSGRVVMTGGVVAYNPLVAELLGRRANLEITVAPHPQEMGAFGAALFAAEH